jgi:hypothetical protein
MADSIVPELPPLPPLTYCQIKHIPGFTGYAVTDTGEVWSTYHSRKNRRFWVWKHLKPYIEPETGRAFVTLYQEWTSSLRSKAFRRSVHSLVLIAFGQPSPGGVEVCHRNGHAIDNSFKNLYWGSHFLNMSDMSFHMNLGKKPFQMQLLTEHPQEIRIRKPKPHKVGIQPYEIVPPLPQLDYAEIRHLAGWKGYAITDNGEVWSCRQKGFGYGRFGVWKRLNPMTIKRGINAGRKVVRLPVPKPKGFENFFVHRLVLIAFIGPCPDGMEGCHEDGNPGNNRLSNLRWGTHQSNQQDMRRHGRTKIGESSPNAKHTVEEVLAIRLDIKNGVKPSIILQTYKLPRGTYYAIRDRHTWKDFI